MRPVSTAYRFETAAGRKREGVLLARRHYPLSSSAPPSSWKCVCVYVCVCMCVSWCGCAAAGQRPLLRQSDPSFLPLPHLPASHSTLSFFLSFPALFVAFSPLSAPQQTPEGIWIWAGETADKETGEREERREGPVELAQDSSARLPLFSFHILYSTNVHTYTHIHTHTHTHT